MEWHQNSCRNCVSNKNLAMQTETLETIVMLEDNQNTLTGCWKLRQLREVYLGVDGLLRDVEIQILAIVFTWND